MFLEQEDCRCSVNTFCMLHYAQPLDEMLRPGFASLSKQFMDEIGPGESEGGKQNE